MMRHGFEGEREIKEQAETYLLPTASMIEHGYKAGGSGTQRGDREYRRYLERALYPELLQEAAKAAMGALHKNESEFELPTQMEHLRERATPSGETLVQLYQRITLQQLVVGRIGLLGDWPTRAIGSGSREGFLSTYWAERGINYDDGKADKNTAMRRLRMVVLDETSQVRSGFTWKERRQYRVLSLGKLTEEPQDDDGSPAVYLMGVTEDKAATIDELKMEPVQVVGKELDALPFEFINSRDLDACPDRPPLLGLAFLALAIYRGEADRRQTLFQSGQDTLATYGTVQTKPGQDKPGPITTGANGHIAMKQGDRAEYVGISGAGLPEMRQTIEEDQRRGKEMAGDLVDVASREKESGEALRMRVASRTATLSTIASVAGFGMQAVCRTMARAIGADESKVAFYPSLDFGDDSFATQQVAELWQAKLQGLPMAEKSVHAVIKARGLTDLPYEEELAEIERETQQGRGLPPASTADDGPERDGKPDGKGEGGDE